eukprot:TRINITY_DN2455_c4_g1_i1.p1 TRINITY_DN2455_c4_g1~~TRINITY_DN2455_c4_g1_i1.p1  ORF type:complete len:306 (-),score=49.53 TRINITY_DN2455_c4_g1_i1:388-1305(-)
MSASAREVELEVPAQMLGSSSGNDSDSHSPNHNGLRMRSSGGGSTPNSSVFSGGIYQDDDLPSVAQEAPTEEERAPSIFLVVFAILDIISSFIVMCVAFSIAWRSVGASLWSLGIQALSHLLSSILLAMRFIAELRLPKDGGESLLRDSRKQMLYREQGFSVAMGLTMLISSAALVFKAFRKIKFWNQWYQDQIERQKMDEDVQWATEFLAWYGFAFYLMQAMIRFVVARRLRRSIVWHAFATSVVSLLFLFVMGFAASYEKEWSWKAEPIAAIGLAFVNLFEGIRIVINHLDDMDTRIRFDARA